MEIREFAEHILFSRKLGDKLFCPENLTDFKPNYEGALPESPYRDKNSETILIKKNQGFPKLSQLSNEKNIARVMHYFANHELLALEIMALVLLKFPLADSAFRRGIVKTMLEEQEHLKLYCQRMNELGMEFGEISQNDYFWRSMADMEEPKDFCLKMGMTFEQANLDFSRYYLQVFEQLGDLKTRDILKQVYEDEISHVGFGLHWYKHWGKASEENLFEEHKKALRFPLGLQRAKAGKVFFDEEGRRRAGFPPQYIESLELFSASKERPSVARYFNPESEMAVADGRLSYSPDKVFVSLQNSLQHMLSVAGLSQDIVLCNQMPGKEYLKNLWNAEIAVPEFLEVTSFRSKGVYESLKHRSIERLVPWGECPDSQRAMGMCEGISKSPSKLVELEDLKLINSQSYSSAMLIDFYKQLKGQKKDLSFLLEEKDLPQLCKNSEELETALREISGGVVLKADFGLSGRGVHFFTESQKKEALEKGVKLLKEQKFLVVERHFPRVLDFSLQLDLNQDPKSCLKGIARFLVDSKGKYLGGILGRRILEESSQEVRAFWNFYGRSKNEFLESIQELAQFVAERLQEKAYKSVVGVDCFLYEEQGGLKWKPLVEINPRVNMGWLNISLHKKIHPKAVGLWLVVPRKKLLPSLMDRYFQGHTLLELEKGLWKKGVFFASDLSTNGDWVALVSVGSSLEEARKQILGDLHLGIF